MIMCECSLKSNTPKDIDIVAVTIIGPGGTDYERTFTYHGSYNALNELIENNATTLISLERFGAPYVKFGCPVNLIQKIELVGKISPTPGESYLKENKIPVNQRKIYKFS